MIKTIFSILFLYSTLFSQIKLTILHTNNLNSTLENCICPDHPFGSIEKIKPLLDKIRQEEKNVLLFDSGDILSPFGNIHKDKAMLSALPYLKYDVMTAGDQDFLNGMDFFKENFIKKGFPLISANLSIDVEPYVIKKIGKIRIGIIAITSSDAFKFFPEEKRGEIEVKDFEKQLRKYLDEIKNKTDYIILLSHSGLDEDKKIAEKFKEIDLIIGGHSQNVLKNGEKVGNTLIVQAGSDGYFLGRVDITFDDSKSVKVVDSQLIPVGIELENDPQIVEIIKKFDFTFIKKAVKTQKLVTPISTAYIITDASKCKKCHYKEYKAWEKSPHAHSWQSLVKDKKTKSMKCVSCHVSGFGRENGFINENITAEMKNVSCVDCHYTKEEHLKKKNRETVELPTVSTCVRCHDKKNDADFDFKKAVPRIKH